MKCKHVFFFRINRHIQLTGKSDYKFSVTFGIRAAQAVIQVGDCRVEGIFRCQRKHNMGKCNRIRASGDSHKYRVSPGIHPVV